ncbi:biotin carboxyl carrier protein of acetyl-CoA carboxylase 2 [Pyrus ussuriensis x Pyrus communis]|uniref:Biotin carboxyl carrier protein of acetyl-CoA carboxylase 2 n=1 Tax=Pyrus ussuriensis x Pyrus communis TaxID=2448454 RepID=A0A5N5GSN7_9ROSA|nr:biotin carboxyl carrier protein of acetyl-CoA carboxylase 2 [Pyrus ussuriensis x Pyrus communis]
MRSKRSAEESRRVTGAAHVLGQGTVKEVIGVCGEAKQKQSELFVLIPAEIWELGMGKWGNGEMGRWDLKEEWEWWGRDM